MSQRIENLQKKLKFLGLDAFFVTGQYNVSYLTGFSGLSPHEREGFLLVTRRKAFLLTFPSYYDLFKNGGKNFAALNITHQKRLKDHLKEIITREKIKNLAVEKNDITLGEFDSLKSNLKVKFMETEGLVEEQRIIKDSNEIAKIKKAAEFTDQAFYRILEKIKAGLTEKDIALELEYTLKKTAGDMAFPPIVAFGDHAAIPHYLPSHNSQLTTNNLILMDFGAKYEGYCSDMTRVVFSGKPTLEQIKTYNTVLEAQNKSIKALKIGKSGQDIDTVSRDYIIAQGYPEYGHGLGHGVGLAIHEDPRLKKDSADILKENMIVTVEPGIYLSGNIGIRIEDLVLIKQDGTELLSHASKEMVVL